MRIPLKRRHHWVFLLFVAGLTWWAVVVVLEQAQPTVQGYYSLLLIGNVGLANTDLFCGLLYLFVVQFTSRNMTVWQKLIASGIIGYGVIESIAVIADEPLFFASARVTPTGYVLTPGPYLILVRPFGVAVLGIFYMGVIFFQIISSYRTTKSPLLRNQLKFLAAGTAVNWLSGQLNVITFLSLSLPAGSLQVTRVLMAAILLVGLTRHGFYGAVPTSEAAGAIPMRCSLQNGRSFLAKSQEAAFEAFAELVRNGREGLCITRASPESVRETYGLQTTPQRWLAEENRGDAIPPSDLLGLSLSIKDFIGRAKGPVVMLQGVEYLSRVNGFAPILRLIDGLNEAIVQKNGILLIPVLPKTLKEQEEAQLAAETVPLPQASAAS